MPMLTRLTSEDSRLVSEQEDLLTGPELAFVRMTIKAAREKAFVAGIPAAMDDRCAKLEAAIVRYAIESRKEEPTLVADPRPFASPAQAAYWNSNANRKA